MTAAELLEQLRLLPPETPVLVEGYESGLDTIVLLRQTAVTRYRKVQDWDGEYREELGGTPAAVLLGHRGHRRGKEVGPPHMHSSRSRMDESSAETNQMDVLLDAKAFADRRGCLPESLPKACGAHRIFCVTINRVPMYPAFYVDPRFNQKQLEAITKVLGGLTGGSKWQFFTSPKGSLGSVTPLQALLAGRHADVRASALAFFER